MYLLLFSPFLLDEMRKQWWSSGRHRGDSTLEEAEQHTNNLSSEDFRADPFEVDYSQRWPQ